MTKTRAMSGWLVSVLLVSLAAALSWQSFEVSADVGGGLIQITGFQAFPLIGTLISLQVVAVLLSLLVRPSVIRYLVIAIMPVAIWSLVDVFFNSTRQVELSFESTLAEKTGVITDSATSEFLVTSSGSLFPSLYLVFVVVNIIVLVLVAVTAPNLRSTASKPDRLDHPEDLWSNQK